MPLPAPPDPRRAGAVLTVDLDAIAANWRTIRALARADGRLAEAAAVLKADAYGMGAPAVGRRLYAEGCRQFFVAHVEEGMALRAALPADAWICVLNGAPPGAEADLAAHGLAPALNDLGQLAAWRNAAQRAGRPLDAVLHLDTGMNRLGFCEQEALLLGADRGRLRGLRLALIMSHLVSAEWPDDRTNAEQLERFRRLVARLPGAPASLANSSGAFLGPDWHFDLLRPGAALYGLNPTPHAPNPMRPVASLRARIVQVRRVDALEAVGYNAQWRAARPSRIATVAAGYADGYLRTLTNRGVAILQGVEVPVIGRVSMDLITIDVTDAPEAAAVAGGWVELMGPALPPDAIAERAGTNGYEILTSLGARYARVYEGAAA